jgi:hypothetical protein
MTGSSLRRRGTSRDRCRQFPRVDGFFKHRVIEFRDHEPSSGYVELQCEAADVTPIPFTNLGQFLQFAMTNDAVARGTMPGHGRTVALSLMRQQPLNRHIYWG